MKIAIFICGQPRLIDLSLIKYFKNKNIDYDIYIHYWKKLEHYSKKHTWYINNNNLMVQDNLQEILIKYYSPKKILGENP